VTESLDSSRAAPLGFAARVVRLFRPSHQHTAFSATVLLMTTVLLSRVVGYIREVYIAWAFGAQKVTDAYNAGFTIPDWLNYLVAGGTASITFVSIYTRFLAEKKEEDAQKTFSVIITVMTVILAIGIVIAEIFTPQLTAFWFKGFTQQQLDLCNHLTRILLPAQLFFYVGGVVSAVLLARRLFLLPALGPLIYNVSIILGGVFFSRSLGISSLAYGAVFGSFGGIFLISAIGAVRAGAGYRISFDVHNPAFREWVRLSIPLMLGFSMVTVDDWFLRHFAAGSAGDISRLNYAKRLFQVPIAILGQAAGQASFPFFARLFSEKRMGEFASTVNNSVSRLVAWSLLAASFMMSTALPLIDLAYRRGRFHFSDSQETAAYFFWFSLSLALWSAQALYARAYYASGNTLVPMIAATIITAGSFPMYAALFRALSTSGLVIASDLAITANCLVIAVLLHRNKLVSLWGLQWAELGKAALTAVVAGLLSYRIANMVAEGSRWDDVKALGLGSITWAAAVAAGLWLTRSKLLRQLRRSRAAAV